MRGFFRWILGLVSRLIIKRVRVPLFLKDFKETRYDSEFNLTPNPNCYFKNNEPGGVWIYYLNKKNEKIAYISYYTSDGQIGLFFIEEKYQNRGLGKQILEKATNELREKKCKEVWLVSSQNNHPFWSNVNNKSFTNRVPAHPSVTGEGFFRKL